MGLFHFFNGEGLFNRVFLARHPLSAEMTGGVGLSKSYNKSQTRLSRRTKFNSDFWEVRVDQNILEQFSLEQNPHYETEEDVQARFRQRERISRLIPLVLKLMDEVLTPRQREVVYLYFFRKMTEHEISQQLGISVPSVSQHLFGKSRGGKTVGGAIPKLRKKLAQMHIGEFEIPDCQ